MPRRLPERILTSICKQPIYDWNYALRYLQEERRHSPFNPDG
jgi:hypothetical protein